MGMFSKELTPEQKELKNALDELHEEIFSYKGTIKKLKPVMKIVKKIYGGVSEEDEIILKAIRQCIKVRRSLQAYSYEKVELRKEYNKDKALGFISKFFNDKNLKPKIEKVYETFDKLEEIDVDVSEYKGSSSDKTFGEVKLSFEKVCKQGENINQDSTDEKVKDFIENSLKNTVRDMINIFSALENNLERYMNGVSVSGDFNQKIGAKILKILSQNKELLKSTSTISKGIGCYNIHREDNGLGTDTTVKMIRNSFIAADKKLEKIYAIEKKIRALKKKWDKAKTEFNELQEKLINSKKEKTKTKETKKNEQKLEKLIAELGKIKKDIDKKIEDFPNELKKQYILKFFDNL